MGSCTKHFLSVRAESAERPSPSQMQMYRRWSDEITHIVQFQTRPPTTTTTWVKTIRHRVISGPFLSIHSQRPARTTRRNARPSRKTHRIGLRSYTAEKFCSRLSHSAVSSSDSESASAGAFAPHVIGMPRFSIIGKTIGYPVYRLRLRPQLHHRDHEHANSRSRGRGHAFSALIRRNRRQAYRSISRMAEGSSDPHSNYCFTGLYIGKY
jgi:hypothetical protein